MQPDAVKGPAKKKPVKLHPVVEKDARQLAGAVNVVVREPTDMLTLLQRSKGLTDKLRQPLRNGASRRFLIFATEKLCWKLQLYWKMQRNFPEASYRRLKFGALFFNNWR